MPVKYIAAAQLAKYKPNASCCDCSKEVADDPEEQIWTIWNDSLIYCPDCARHENVGLNN